MKIIIGVAVCFLSRKPQSDNLLVKKNNRFVGELVQMFSWGLEMNHIRP